MVPGLFVLNRVWFQLCFLCSRQGSKIVGDVQHRLDIFVSFLS